MLVMLEMILEDGRDAISTSHMNFSLLHEEVLAVVSKTKMNGENVVQSRKLQQPAMAGHIGAKSTSQKVRGTTNLQHGPVLFHVDCCEDRRKAISFQDPQRSYLDDGKSFKRACCQLFKLIVDEFTVTEKILASLFGR